MALGPKGELVIVEVKSGVADFPRRRQMARIFRLVATAICFAVSERFPRTLLPEHTGLIIADAFGGAIVRESPAQPPRPRTAQIDHLALCPHRSRTRDAAGPLALARGALGENALQGAPVHVQPPRGFRHIVIAQLEYALDMLPAHPVGRSSGFPAAQA